MKKKMCVLWSLLLCLFFVQKISAQTEMDTLTTATPDSLGYKTMQLDDLHKKAFSNLLRSALVPSWGQFHNQQPLKGALLGAGTLAGISTAVATHAQFKSLEKEYNNRVAGAEPLEYVQFSNSQLFTKVNSRKNIRNIAIGTGVYLYAVQLIDAYVGKVVIEKKQDHSPQKAAFLSAVLPGAGQIYNRKLWKLPIVYGALGLSGYYVFDNARKHRAFKQAYINRENEDFTPSAITEGFTDASLLTARQFYLRNLEVSSIVMGALYAINIIDAVVDAHLFDFYISDDVSLTTLPQISHESYGLSLRLQF